MGELKSDLQKTWKVEYNYSLFKSPCQGCNLNTRERVLHVIIDYYGKDTSPYLISLGAPWHRVCHDEKCRHDFCVEDKRRWLLKREFGDYMVEIVLSLDNRIEKEDVPKFLSSPHPKLNGLSPLQMIWKYGERGFERVMQIIEGTASGAFV